MMKVKENLSVNAAEVAQFDAIGGSWWDEQGPFKPLHLINPVRLRYVRDQVNAHFKADQQTSKRANQNLTLLDVGCGGGLLCEPLTRQGFQVTGLDASPAAIATAKVHALESGLKINYVCGTVENFLDPLPLHLNARTRSARKGRENLSAPTESLPLPLRERVGVRGHNKFDIITALEIIEHVDNPAAFVASCGRLLKPGGLIIFSTLNRTVKSWLLGKIAAEYVLRLVPAGTHTWQKFVKPSELSGYVRAADLTVQDVAGLIFNPAAPNHALFSLSKRDVAVNYFMTAKLR